MSEHTFNQPGSPRNPLLLPDYYWTGSEPEDGFGEEGVVQEGAATGVEMVGIEAPADGTWVELVAESETVEPEVAAADVATSTEAPSEEAAPAAAAEPEIAFDATVVDGNAIVEDEKPVRRARAKK